MFQYPGAGNRTLLGNMSHNKYGYPIALRQLQKNSCGFPHLGNAARSRGNLLLVHSLYGVNNYDLRLFPGNRPFDFPQIGFA